MTIVLNLSICMIWSSIGRKIDTHKKQKKYTPDSTCTNYNVSRFSTQIPRSRGDGVDKPSNKLNILKFKTLYSLSEPYPRKYGEDVRSTSKDKWFLAVYEELNALDENDVWRVVVPPKNSHVLYTK